MLLLQGIFVHHFLSSLVQMLVVVLLDKVSLKRVLELVHQSGDIVEILLLDSLSVLRLPSLEQFLQKGGLLLCALKLSLLLHHICLLELILAPVTQPLLLELLLSYCLLNQLVSLKLRLGSDPYLS